MPFIIFLVMEILILGNPALHFYRLQQGVKQEEGSLFPYLTDLIT